MSFAKSELEGNIFPRDKESILVKYNFIKYAAYRVASKLRKIQKVLGMSEITLSTISSVFEKHQLQKKKNNILDKFEIKSILSDMYFIIFKEKKVDSICQSMISFLFNIYDSQKEDKIPLLCFKICLTLFSLGKPREKYLYFFSMLADNNNCLSKKAFRIFLIYLVKILDFIEESSSFGLILVEGTVRSCFETNRSVNEISEKDFISWLSKDPQLLTWLSVLYRIQISEKVVHPVNCKICKIYPIVGLRYQCLRCLSVNICETCFFLGKTNEKHKLNHSIQEYCYPQTAKQSFKAFFVTIRNTLFKKSYKLQYLPVTTTDPARKKSFNLDSDTNKIFSQKVYFSDFSASKSSIPVKTQLNLLLNLDKRNSKLIFEIENLGLSDIQSVNYCKSQIKNLLLKHKMEINNHIKLLDLLRKKDFMIDSKLQHGTESPTFTPSTSTPVIKDFSLSQKKMFLNKNLNSLSPIINYISSTKKELSNEKSLLQDLKSLEKEEERCSRNFLIKNEKLDLSTSLEEINLNVLDCDFKSDCVWLRSSSSKSEIHFDELDCKLLLVLNKFEDLLNDPGLQNKISLYTEELVFD